MAWRSPLGVAALVLVAGVAMMAGARPQADLGRPRLVVNGPVIVAENLFPTRAEQPDPHLVAAGEIPLPTGVRHRLTAVCTNCDEDPGAAAQFEALRIEVNARGPGGIAYEGPLVALNTELLVRSPQGAKVRVWLADNGKPQPQGVTTMWTFNVTPLDQRA